MRLEPGSVALPVHPLLPVWIEQNEPFLHCVQLFLAETRLVDLKRTLWKSPTNFPKENNELPFV